MPNAAMPVAVAAGEVSLGQHPAPGRSLGASNSCACRKNSKDLTPFHTVDEGNLAPPRGPKLL